MKIAKYEHACLVAGEQGKQLIIDPGVFVKQLPDLQNVVAIVVTHVHPDHYSPEHLASILRANPGAKIFTVSQVAETEKGAAVVRPGEVIEASPFRLEFFGGQHAVIHSSIPVAENVGVLVNRTIYYPGDSFAQPSESVQVLAIPAHAPWMKTGEAMDFLASVKPQTAFPTHNAFINKDGQALTDRLLGGMAQSLGTNYKLLKPGESLEV